MITYGSRKKAIIYNYMLFIILSEQNIQVLEKKKNKKKKSRYQEEVYCVSFGKSQDWVYSLLYWNKLPGQLRNTGWIRLVKEKATHHISSQLAWNK